MLNFDYLIPTEIIFGKGEIKKLEKKIKNFNRILFVWGGGSIKRIGVYEKVIDALKDKTYFELSGIKPNPRLSSVKKGVAICRKNDIDFILAVGGGSVIDCSKAIAAGVYKHSAFQPQFLLRAHLSGYDGLYRGRILHHRTARRGIQVEL